MKKLCLITALVLMVVQCQQPQTVTRLDKAAIEAHGGSLYQTVKKIHYIKKIWSLSKTGDTLSENTEKHWVDFDKNYARIAWTQNGIQWQAIGAKEGVRLIANDSLVNDSIALKKVRRRLDGAQFVFWQPFKYVKDGGQKNYKGMRTLFNGWKVHEIEVTYPNSNDRWSFFFDHTNNRLRATGVLHNNRYSLITNDQQEGDTGLYLHQQRSSYFTDSLFRPQRKSTLYSYDLQQINY